MTETTQPVLEKKMYSPDEVSAILMKGRSATYDFIKKVYEDGEPFRVIKVGKAYRIPKKSFDAWLDKM